MTILLDSTARHYIYNHSCIDVMRDHIAGGTYKADFIFADPPFNIGEKYDSYDDVKNPLEFARFTIDWFTLAAEMLRNGGILAVHIPDSMVDLVTVDCGRYDNNSLQMQRIAWIIWHYRFAQHRRGGFINSKCHLLVFRRGNLLHTFNDADVSEPSDRASVYNDERTNNSDTPGMRCMFDVWTDIPRLTGNAKERIGESNGYSIHPNQLPEAYLERILLAYTNVNDMVIDIFGGTGTTAAVCKRLGRRSLTCEVSENYCRDIKRRLDNTVGAILKG